MDSSGNNNGKRKIFGFDGGYVSVMSGLFDILILSLLWLLCSFPVFTAGASCSALYHTVVRSVKEGKGYAVKEFFRAFRRDFRQSLLPWMGILIVETAAGWGIWFLINNASDNISLFFIMFYGAVFLYVLSMATYLFCALSRFEMPTVRLLKFSACLVIKHIGTTGALLLIDLCMGILVWRLPFLILILPGPMTFLISEFTERVLKQYEPEEETDRKEE